MKILDNGLLLIVKISLITDSEHGEKQGFKEKSKKFTHKKFFLSEQNVQNKAILDSMRIMIKMKNGWIIFKQSKEGEKFWDS